MKHDSNNSIKFLNILYLDNALQKYLKSLFIIQT